MEQQGICSTYQLTAHTHTGVGQGGLVDPSVINHDALLNFVGAEHLVLANTLINVLTDHNKVAHDALGLSHDSLADVSVNDHHNQAHTLASHSTKAHAELTGVTANLHHPQAHNLDTHAVRNHANLQNITSDQHHPQAHNLASHATRNHADLLNIPANQHLVLPNTIAQVLSDHTKAAHDALAISNLAAEIILGGTNGKIRSTNGRLSLETNNPGTEYVCSQSIYDVTTAQVANIHVYTNAIGPHALIRSTSALKYKDKVKDLELDSSLIYNLRPVSFNSLCKPDDKNKRFIGLVADEVEKIYPEIIIYSDKKKVEAYDSQMLMTLYLAEIQNLNQRIKQLEH